MDDEVWGKLIAHRMVLAMLVAQSPDPAVLEHVVRAIDAWEIDGVPKVHATAIREEIDAIRALVASTK
jgi:hypothetical protein